MFPGLSPAYQTTIIANTVCWTMNTRIQSIRVPLHIQGRMTDVCGVINAMTFVGPLPTAILLDKFNRSV